MSTDRFYDAEGHDGRALVMVRDEGFVRPASVLELDLRAERDRLAEALREAIHTQFQGDRGQAAWHRALDVLAGEETP